MKKLFLVLVLTFVVANWVMAQVWTYDSDLAIAPQPHGVVVDNNDKIWVGYYGPADSLLLPDGTYMRTDPLRCYKPDGTQESFSPIMIFTDGATFNDTLDFAKPFSCRGISLDNNGNVLYVGSRGQLYRINAQTGEGMNKLITPVVASLTSPGVDENGFIYQAHVGGGNPCYIFDEDFNLYSYVADTVKGLQRSIVVTPDGKDVYMGKIYSGSNGITHYHSDDGPDGTYTLVDTLWYDANRVMWGQCIDWDRNGLLWVGTYWDVGLNDFTGWYALDPTQDWAVVDTCGQNVGVKVAPVAGVIPAGGTYHSPRHAAWSLDGKTMYTADFDGAVVKKWTNPDPKKPGAPPIYTTLVEALIANGVPKEFLLGQNYPNPFNPITTIPFTIERNGLVILKVYDIMGREVKSLVNEHLNAGSYQVNFDGTGLPSGSYYYRITLDGQVQAKHMMLLK